MDSLLNYIGHKSRLLDQILPHLPTAITGVFYDAFAGSGVVGLSVPYGRVVCNEINPHLVALYGDLSHPGFTDQLVAMIDRYSLTNSSVTPRSQYLTHPDIGTVTWMGEIIPNLHLDQLNKRGYTQLIRDFNSGRFSGIEASCAYMIATLYGRNSAVATNLATGALSGSVGPLDYSRRAAQKLEEHRAVLSGGRHQFTVGSYADLAPGPHDFVYIDPPYLASGYRYGGWTDDDETALLGWIDRLPCGWALSNTLQSGSRVNTLLERWCVGRTVIPLEKRYRKWASAGTGTVTRAVKINREVLVLSDTHHTKST